MSEKLKRCEACNDPFYESDVVIEVGDDVYHKDCVELYTAGYVAYSDGNFLGETENDDGTDACELFEEDEYLEDEE